MLRLMTKKSAKYYIGLMSGTSADGIDLALVDFCDPENDIKIIASYYQAYSVEIAKKITSFYNPSSNEIDRAFSLDVELAHCFYQAIKALLAQENLIEKDIIAIGSHGQTIRHRPRDKYAFTLQIGCNQTLACLTGIKVIGKFRVKDIALGGQGAPLVPVFHQQIFAQKNDDVFVVNIGGIANITFLPAQTSSQHILGFDTGPGNALLDDWFKKHHANSSLHYDENGDWAKQGQVIQGLLKELLSDVYFSLTAPKSTGREYFHLPWLDQQLVRFSELNNKQVSPITWSHQDVQATLTAFTAITIANDIKALAKSGNVYLCGGGAHNQQLLNLLKHSLLSDEAEVCFTMLPTTSCGIDGDLLEAIAFAWLAFAYDHKLPSNMPEVTGAKQACTLGIAFLP